MPKMARAISVLPGADQAGKTEDLTRRSAELEVMKAPRRGETFHAEVDRRLGRVSGATVQVFDLSPNHHAPPDRSR